MKVTWIEAMPAASIELTGSELMHLRALSGAISRSDIGAILRSSTKYGDSYRTDDSIQNAFLFFGRLYDVLSRK